jgi:hypothetical protein
MYSLTPPGVFALVTRPMRSVTLVTRRSAGAPNGLRVHKHAPTPQLWTRVSSVACPGWVATRLAYLSRAASVATDAGRAANATAAVIARDAWRGFQGEHLQASMSTSVRLRCSRCCGCNNVTSMGGAKRRLHFCVCPDMGTHFLFTAKAV